MTTRTIQKEKKKILSMVEQVTKELEKNPTTRDNDKLLTFRIIQKRLKQRGPKLVLDVNNLDAIPGFYSVQRARQLVISGHPDYNLKPRPDLQPTDPSLRKKRENAMRAALRRKGGHRTNEL